MKQIKLIGFVSALLLALVVLSTAATNQAAAAGPVMKTLTLSKTTISGGASLTGTARLDLIAPAEGAVVTLSSTNTAYATVPASVTVASQRVTAVFTINTLAASSNRTVTIRATFGGVTKSVVLNITPPKLIALSGPSTLPAPATATGTVQIEGLAPSGGFAISLSSNNSSKLSVPGTVTIASGKSTANFTMSGSTVTANTNVTLTGTGGGVSKTKVVTVIPATLAPLGFTPSSINGGKTTKGTVSLYQVAPTGGAVVTLTSSVPGVLPVPVSVTVPAGLKSTSFTLTSVSGQPVTPVTLTASYRGTVRSAVVTVSPAPIVVSKITMTPNPVGSQSVVTTTFQLTGAAPAAGVNIIVTSSSGTIFPIAGNYTVPAGQDKLILTRTTGTVTATNNVTVAASANGTVVTSTLVVKPWVLLSLNVSATSAISYGSVTATVALTGPAPAAGSTITLTSTEPLALAVPASVKIPGGSSSYTFTLTAKKVDFDVNLLLGAAGGGGTSQKSFKVIPLQVVSWGSFQSSTPGGLVVTTTININGAAPAGGAAILITSSNPAVSSVPATVVVPAGGFVGTLEVNAAFVTSNVDTVISATLGPVRTLTSNLQVRPPSLTSVESYVWPTLHEATYTGTINMFGPAYPTTGLNVALTSSDPTVVVPATVNVLPYGTTATFPMVVGTVTTPEYVTITATYRTRVRTLTVYVVPVGPWGGEWSFNPVWSADSNVDLSLTGNAPAGGLDVAVTYGNCITGPATVHVPAGQNYVRVPVRGIPVVNSRYVNMTLTANGLTSTLYANCPVATASLSLSASSVKGGQSVNATVTYNVAAPAGGFSTTVTSDITSVVPGVAITIPAGSTSGTVTLPTLPVSSTSAPKVRVQGTSGGSSRTLTVLPPVFTSFTLASNTTTGGFAVVGTIHTDSAAPASGLVINLSSNNAKATVPATVTIPAGATVVNFNVTTLVVTATTNATITTTLNGASLTQVLSITPAVLPADIEELPVVESNPVEPATPEATVEATPEATEVATEPAATETPVAEPTVEATPEPTVEPVVESTPEPVVTEVPAEAPPAESTPTPEETPAA